jgi:hypothetical protein
MLRFGIEHGKMIAEPLAKKILVSARLSHPKFISRLMQLKRSLFLV